MNSREADVRFVRDAAGLEALAGEWRRMAADARRFAPDFDDVAQAVRADPDAFLIAVAEGRAGIRGIACFHAGPVRQRYAVGERQVAEVSLRAATLRSGTWLGDFPEAAWLAIFAELRRAWDVPVIVLGETADDSPLTRAVAEARWPLVGLGARGRGSVHWYIELPPTFDVYLDMLRKSTKRSLRHKLNRFERAGATRFETIATDDGIDRFLREGEAISRRTYQWNVGQRLENDAATRERYFRLSRAGRLRCYLLYLDETPIAFLRGEVSGAVYHYETPGFLPEYERHSPGLVLLALAIRELIEHGQCRIFDFGTGGDLTGYKARFGTLRQPCHDLSIVDVTTFPGARVWFLHHAFSVLKLAGNAVVGQGWLKRRLKKAIRRYEDDGHQGED